MDLNTKLKVLDQIYKIYHTFVRSLDIACQRYCAKCCTCNVTLTTLEGYKIFKYIITHQKTNLLTRILKASKLRRFQPEISINEIAAFCMNGEKIPAEECDPNWGTCSLLSKNDCLLYPVRPFGCRCLVSMHDCRETGYAEVAGYIVTVNTVFLQMIEHIDADGCSGNLTDILLTLASKEHREAYERKALRCSEKGLVTNQSIKYLMIPPEHQVQVDPLLQALLKISVPVEKKSKI